MARTDIDRQTAAAEAGLDRVDDGAPVPDARGEVELDDGMHLEDLDASPYDVDGDEDADGHAVAEAAEVLDALVEAFNARDLEAVDELCAPDCEVPGFADGDDLRVALPDLWTRRPTIAMTRAVRDGHALGVVWERGETAGWAALGTVHVAVDGRGRLHVVEFSDDSGLLDELDADPPDGDLDEGSRWEEWDEGADAE